MDFNQLLWGSVLKCNRAHDIPSGYDKSFLDFVKSKATGVNKFECDLYESDNHSYQLDERLIANINKVRWMGAQPV